MGKYIDSNGLSHLIGLFKPALLPSGGSAGQVLVKSSATDYDVSWATSSGGSASTYYATCSTTASTAAKAVTVSGWTPAAGDILGVYFSTANTAGVPTLTVNSTNYAIRVGNAAPSATTNTLKWSAATMLWFMFDGTYFRYMTAKSGATLNAPDGAGTWYGTCSTAATAAAKTSSITNFRLTPGAIVSLNCSTANTYTSGALTLNVNSTGAKTVYANNAATSASNTLEWSAGTQLTFVYSGSYWYFTGSSRSSSVTVDSAISSSSVNPVQNSAIYTALGGKVDTESTNGTDTAIVSNASGAIEFAATDGTNDTLVDVGSFGVTIETTDGTDTSGITIEPGNVTITNSGIAASHVMITGASGDVQTSSVTSTELYRLSGITSNVQSQLDSAKTTATAQHVTATLTTTIAANGSASGTLQATIPTGYTPVSVMCSALSNAFLMDLRVLSIDTSGLITYYIRNTSTSSAITGGTATFNVACVKTA